MRKKLLRWLPFMIVPLVFTSCQLMPEEEVLPAVPVVRSYEVQEYEWSTVMRGDLVSSKNVRCTYMPAKEEKLSFSLGGVYIDKIHVSQGQQVEAGQVLAELEQENLQEQISDQEYLLKTLKLTKSHIQENMQLNLSKYDIILADIEWEMERTSGMFLSRLEKEQEQQEKWRAESEKQYQAQLQDVEDSIYIQNLRLEEMQENLRERQITADFDGTVTYVRKVTDGQLSVKGQTFITISDMNTTVFAVKGDDAVYFPAGTEVILTCQKKEFVAHAVEAKELGLPEAKEDEDPIAYLKLSQPDPTLEDGDNGTINLVLDERKNVLYVDKAAIKTANGQPFVYLLNEEDLRVMQEVSTGLVSGDYIEIISGLKEGDRVIVD